MNKQIIKSIYKNGASKIFISSFLILGLLLIVSVTIIGTINNNTFAAAGDQFPNECQEYAGCQGNDKKVSICHYPGPHLEPNTLCINQSSLSTHDDHHEDYCGECVPSPPEADLAIEITDVPAATTSEIGSNMEYQITVTNNGPDNATDALVTVDVPAILLGATWTCTPYAGSSCSASGTGSISDTVNIISGGTIIYTLLATIDPTTNETSLTVPAEVALTEDPDTSNNTDSDTNDLVKAYDITISKTSPNNEFVPGTPITYVLTISNAGPSAVLGGTVTDTLPSALTDATWTCTPTPTSPSTSCTASGTGDINDTVDIEVGGQIQYTVSATIDPSATGTLSNTVTFDSNDGLIKEDNHQEELTPKTDLSVTKTDGETEATPGEEVTYTMTVTNGGPSDVIGAVITDTLPTVLTNATWSCTAAPGSTCGDASGTGNINTTADMPVNGSVTYTLTATINSGAAGTLTNIITVSAPQGYTDPDNSNNSDTDTNTLVAVTDLQVTKTDNKTVAVPGTENTYTIVVTNTGPSDVSGEFSDPIPTGLLNATWTCTASSVNSTCSASGTGDITDTILVKPGENVTYTLVADIDPSAENEIVNTATVTIPNTDPEVTFSDTDTTTLEPSADLAIDITDFPASTTSTAGENILYVIEVTNNGPSDASGAEVTVNVPAILLSPSWTCTASAGSTCTASQTGNINDTVYIKTGGTLTYSLSATIDPATTATTLTVPAEVDFAGDSNLSNNSDSDTNNLEKEYDISVTKTSSNTEFIPGTPVTYILTISNAGPSAILNGTVTDTLPPELSGATWTCVSTPTSASTTCSPSGTGNINDTVKIEVGGQIQYTVIANIDPSATGILSNTVEFDSNDGLVIEDNHEGDLTPKADLEVTKTDEATEVTPGDEVTYTIVVTNNGPSDVVGAMIYDNVPAVLNSPTWSCSATSGSSCGDATGTGDIDTTADILTGGSVTYTLTATLDIGAAGSLTNTVEAEVPKKEYTDPNNNNNSDTDINTIAVLNPELVVSKTDNKTEAVPGTETTYTIVITNMGLKDVSGEFSDPLPTELLNATWTCVPSTLNSSCTESGTGDITDNAVFIKAGEYVTYTLTGTIDPTAENEIVNTATITIPQTEPLLTFSDSDTTTLTPEADLEITKVIDGEEDLIPGGTVTYTITATNNGPSAVNQAAINDTMPSELVPESIEWTCTPSEGATCATSGTGNISDLVYLPVNGSVVYTITATIDSEVTEQFNNIVTIEPPAEAVTETDYENNTASVANAVIAETDVAISISDSPDPLDVNSIITYTTQVLNKGPITAQGTVVTIDLPTGTSLISATTSLGTCSGTTQIICNLGDLAVNTPVTITIEAVPSVAGTITTNASVSSTTTDKNLANNTSSASTNVTSPSPSGTSAPSGGGGGAPTRRIQPELQFETEPEPEPEEPYCLSYYNERQLIFTDLGLFEKIFQDITNALKGTYMVQKGYKDLDQYVISGYNSFSNDVGEREVKLDLNVTRLQWAKLLMTAHCLRIFDATKLPPVTFFGSELLEFADLPLQHIGDENQDWYTDVMYSAKYYEILDGTYQSNAELMREITFAEAVKMLVRAGEAAGTTPFDLFSRLEDANPWYLKYYSRAIAEGIMIKPFGIDINLEANATMQRKYILALLLRAAIVRGLYNDPDMEIIENQF